jgi:hypothetical protein
VSFFAVLDRDTPGLRVLQAHFNLWSLGALFRRIFVCDVGLLLQAPSDHTLDRVSIVIPFSIYNEETHDLIELIQVKDIAVLVFGEPVEVRNPPRAEPLIATAADTFSLKRLSLHRATYKEIGPPATATLCSMPLDTPIEPGATGYVRMRFRVRKQGRAWQWRRHIFGVRRALIDVRVNDVRESVQRPELRELERHIIAIESLHFFVIADWQFQMRVASPQQKLKIRVLEGGVWERYLRRAPDLFRRAKLVIYHFTARGQQDPIVDTVNPFRAFLDLSSDDSMAGWRMAVVQLVVVAVTVWTIVDSGASRIGNATAAVISGLALVPLGFNGYGSVIGLLVLLSIVLAVVPPTRHAVVWTWRWLGRIVRSVEDSVLYRAASSV